MYYKEIEKYTIDSEYFDELTPEKISTIKLSNGVLLKQYPYFYKDIFGNNFVNIYALEISNTNNIGFGMEFAKKGDYCINLAKNANKKTKGKLIAAVNCNFGLIVDEYDRYPTDMSYNLHIENKKLIQIPVVDKPAILINNASVIDMKFIHAEGRLKIGTLAIDWIGSQSKKYNYFYARERCIVYNSYNRGLLLVKDETTGTKKFFDPNYSNIPFDRKKIDVVVTEINGLFFVKKINFNKGTHFFEGNFILSVPYKYIDQIRLGDLVEILSIGTINPSEYKYGSTGGPLLVSDFKEFRRNILWDKNVQTRSLENKSAYKKNSKFSRCCIIKTKNKIIFFLADARKEKKGQEGFSMYRLWCTLVKLYPNFESVVNVDGGNAPKLIFKELEDYNVLGNLQYKNWPTETNPNFSWNGYFGRKVPAIIYAYQKAE